MLKTKPFAGLKAGKDSKGQTFFKFDATANPAKIRKYKPRPKPRFAFVLQAFNGQTWKVVRKDGMIITSKQCKEARTKEFAACLSDGNFVSQMKKQIYGRTVGDKEFFATPVRWRRIDAVSLA